MSSYRFDRSQEAFLQGRSLGKQSVGTTVTRIAHGLGYVPTDVLLGPPSVDCRVWQPQEPDRSYIYLQASAACSVRARVS